MRQMIASLIIFVFVGQIDAQNDSKNKSDKPSDSEITKAIGIYDELGEKFDAANKTIPDNTQIHLVYMAMLAENTNTWSDKDKELLDKTAALNIIAVNYMQEAAELMPPHSSPDILVKIFKDEKRLQRLRDIAEKVGVVANKLSDNFNKLIEKLPPTDRPLKWQMLALMDDGINTTEKNGGEEDESSKEKQKDK